MRGIGLRVLALVGVAGAIAATWDNDNSGGDVLAIASLAVGGGMVIWDVAAAPRSARIHNEQVRRRLSIGVTPAASVDRFGVRAAISCGI